MYKIRITAAGQTSKGKPLPVGTVLECDHPTILTHCVPGFRNSPPIAEPVDEFTAEGVAIVLKRKKQIQAANRPIVQQHMNGLAQRLPTDPSTGDFERKDDGTVPGASERDQVTIDNAAAYGIKPEIIAAKPAAESQPETDAGETGLKLSL